MNTLINSIIEDIHKHGLSVQTDYFSAELIDRLLATLEHYREQGQLKQAGIGRQQNLHIEQNIRNDQISWFDDARLSESQQHYLQQIQKLREALNQKLYLGLHDFEVHFAVYAPNAFYKRHLDQHRDQDTRVITVISYLNKEWQESDGGQLRIYLKNGKYRDVIPGAGTLVCFLSNEFEHEVLPANRERFSLTGWFRKRE